jgi:hypothetical protein
MEAVMKSRMRSLTAWVVLVGLCAALIPAPALAAGCGRSEDQRRILDRPRLEVQHLRAARPNPSRITKLIDAIVTPITRLPERSATSDAAGEWWSERSQLEKGLIVGAAAAAVAVGVLVLGSRLRDAETASSASPCLLPEQESRG